MRETISIILAPQHIDRETDRYSDRQARQTVQRNPDDRAYDTGARREAIASAKHSERQGRKCQIAIVDSFVSDFPRSVPTQSRRPGWFLRTAFRALPRRMRDQASTIVAIHRLHLDQHQVPHFLGQSIVRCRLAASPPELIGELAGDTWRAAIVNLAPFPTASACPRSGYRSARRPRRSRYYCRGG